MSTFDFSVFENKLIVFEGSDSTGKTTIAKLLVDTLNKEGIPSIFAFQPGDNYGPIAPFIRSLCKDSRWNLHPMSNLFAFLLDRSEHLSKIVIPALKEGKTVVCDRWSYSTFAYQLMGKQLASKYNAKPEFIDWITHEALLNGKHPDFTFYFTEKVGYREKDNNDNFETQGYAFKKRVQKAYDELAQKLDWIKVYPGISVESTLAILLESTHIHETKSRQD